MTQTLTTDELRQIAETDHTQCGDAAAMARELLANREAQPVAPALPDIGSIVVNDAAWKLHDTLTEHGPLNGRQFNNLKGCLYEALKIILAAPPAPAVPDNLAAAVNRLLDCDGTRGHFSAIRCSDTREEVERLLAQPVSQGYKLVPVEPTPKQWAAGVKVMDTGMDKVTLVYKAMLAAAPEGGNG